MPFSFANMLNADDPASILAVRRLERIAAGERPIVFWIGAGASRWLGYPSWKELTLQLRRKFAQEATNFDNKRALELINKEKFATVLQMCRDADPASYRKFIADAFAPKERTRVYQKFIDLLGEISPLSLLTTNVDEALEKSLPQTETVQLTDLRRCVDLLNGKKSFVAKLHGSVSSVQTTVFTDADYDALISDRSYIQSLKYIFTGCTVVFLGYGVGDSYVLQLLRENVEESELFGAGPHFVVTNEKLTIGSLHTIRYLSKLRPDHSAAMDVLARVSAHRQAKPFADAVPAQAQPEDAGKPTTPGAVPTGKTAYYVSDLMLPGTWQTSQEITAKGDPGEIEGSFGLGFTNDEVIQPFSTALHDLVVGFICFDYVYLPFSVLGSAHNLLGSELFWELIRLDVLRFIHNQAQVGAIFHKGDALGVIGDVFGGTSQGPDPAPLSVLIRKSLTAAPGQEKVAEGLFDTLEKHTAVYERYRDANVPALVRGALLMPAVSRLLGASDAVLPTQVPRWLRFPYLRLAHLVQTAVLCGEYGIQATKVPFGGVQLTTAAFGTQPTDLKAEHLASYVSSGAFNSDLGALIQNDMSIMRSILRFRASSEGEAFRRQTGQVLGTDGGREFNVSVNAGLSRTVPVAVLQKARDRLLTLMTESARITQVPAVWSSTLLSDLTTRYWRAKSQKLLLAMCAERGIGKDDPCICGSGEKLRLCCLAPLRH